MRAKWTSKLLPALRAGRSHHMSILAWSTSSASSPVSSPARSSTGREKASCSTSCSGSSAPSSAATSSRRMDFLGRPGLDFLKHVRGGDRLNRRAGCLPRSVRATHRGLIRRKLSRRADRGRAGEPAERSSTGVGYARTLLVNGIHDMGGMHGFGRVEVERDEPVFHARWEARVFGMVQSLGGGNIDAGRHSIERLDPVTLSAQRLLRALARRAGERSARARRRRARRARARARAGGAGGRAARAAPRVRAGSRRRGIYVRDVDRAARVRAGSASARATTSRPGTRGCPAYARGARRSSTRASGHGLPRRPTRTVAARIRSTSTRCASTAASSGARAPSRAPACTSTFRELSRSRHPSARATTTITTSTSELALRVEALESLLVEKGLVDPAQSTRSSATTSRMSAR